jgi:hypothetical protein
MNFQQLQNEFPPHQFQPLIQAIEVAVRRSLRSHPMLGEMKDSVLLERITWCCDTVVMLRRDKRWTLERIRDNIGHALAHKLTHGDWTPPERNMWLGPE